MHGMKNMIDIIFKSEGVDFGQPLFYCLSTVFVQFIYSLNI